MEEFKITENELRDIQLAEVVSGNTGLSEEESGEVVSHNIITPYQLAKITNKSITAIQNKKGLARVFPFRYKGNKGPEFILFDQNCYDYIISTHKPNALNHEEIPSNK